MTLVGRLIRPLLSSYPDRLMRTTRSSSRNAAPSKMSDTPTTTPSTLGKHEADTELAKNTKKLARQEAASDAEHLQPASDITPVPAVLTFDFQEAKRHLIQADHRFEDLFQKMTCKPFEQLERVNPFRYGFRCPS
jgi:DNA-3-methyladenine glycosylase II